MRKRTFLRTMLDIFLNNAVVKTVVSVVNFCNEQRYFCSKRLKFSQNVPLNKMYVKQYDKRYLFSNEKLKA